MLTRVRHLLELIRFSHTLFALPFALLAAMMAWHFNWKMVHFEEFFPAQATQGSPDTFVHDTSFYATVPVPTASFRWQELVGILLCMVAGRSAAMSFNRLADRDIDALNPRTATRHLPAGILSVGSVTMFAAMSSVAFIAANLIFLPNWLPLACSAPMLLFLLGYSYAKRFTSLAHFWLGAALGLAPISAWIAIRGQIVLVNPADLLPVVVLGGAVMLWVAGFDMIYACQDAQFDQAQRLHSVPARFGIAAALQIAALCHAGMLVLLALVPLVYPLMMAPIWWVGTVAIAALLGYEHWLVKPSDLARVNTAFFNVNAVVSTGLLLVGAVAMSV